MNFRVRKCAKMIFGPIAALAFLVAPQAHALDVDFDVAMIVLDDYIEQAGLSTRLVGNDNDANGLKEDDQLGMLSAILAGGSGVSCISSSRITEITNGYNFNFPKVKTELTVNVQGYGTVDIVNQLAGSNPQLGAALQNTITGFLTVADTVTITFVNNLADALATALLTSLNQTGQINNVKNQINFLASDYRTYGNAPNEANYLGPAGDIENDGLSNLSEYTVGAVPKGRELWLTDCCITAPLRIVTVTGGGLKLSGLPESFTVSVAGGNSNKTFQWRKGTTTSSTVVSNSPNYNISFLTTASSGTYFCNISDGTTTRTTPILTLSVTFVALYISQQPQSVTRNVGSSHTFSVAVAGGVGPGPYQYTWRRGATTVGTNAPTLTLANIQAANAGTYTVRITSNGGGDTITSQNAVLTVNASAFRITQQPVAARRYVGEDLTLTVAVSGGSGNLQYAWTRNGSPFFTSDSPSLVGNGLSLDNAGTYRCIVTDLDTSAQLTSDSALVQIAELLEIIQQPGGNAVSVGEFFSMTVGAQGGFAPLEYQWKWEALSIPGENSPTYDTIAYSGFGGAYTCEVTDANGTSLLSDAAILDVNASVEILQDPQGGDFYVGNTATLSVVATSGSIYTYDWRKDGVSLGRPSTSILSISNLDVDDEGDYSVVVSKAGLGSATSASATVRVRNIPTVDTQPQSVTVYTGDDANFSIAASGGYPPLVLQWRKGVVDVPDATSAALLLRDVTNASQGSYNCLITDQLATQQVSNAASLTVVSRMEITSQPVGGEIYTGDAFNLSVAVSGGVPPLTYVWKRDGNPFGAPNAAQLTFNPVLEANAGVYTCEIADAGEETLTSEAATVDVAPSFSVLAQPQAAMLFVGEPLALSFVVEGGFSPLQYSWRLDNVLVSGAESAAYNIAQVTQDNEGAYICTVRDRLNRVLASTTADVEVAAPLTVSIEPAAAQKYVNEPIAITAMVETGEGDYHYAWRKNGLPFDAPDVATLATEFVQLSDAATYTCLITDSFGSGAQTTGCVVDVQELPTIATEPQDDVAALGKASELTVVINGGFTPIVYAWERSGGSALPSSNSPLIPLAAVLESDAGSYECVITDARGTSLRSLPALLSVVPALAITTQPKNKLSALGQSVSFSMAVSGGVPEVSLSWFKGDTLITTGETLSFPAVEASDFGFYLCIATDGDGNKRSSNVFSLSEVQELTILEQPGDTKRYLGEAVAFTVSALGGSGTLSYAWERDGQPVGGDSSVVEIPAVEVGDAGIYTCTVSNGDATATTNDAELLVAPPLLVDATSETRYPFITSSTEIAVTPSGGFGSYTYEWLQDDVLVSTQGPELQLSNLSLDDSGDYRCIVRDGYGVVDAGIVLHLRVKPEPTTHNADIDSSGSIELTELLRVIQFYNIGALHCQADTEDGYAPLTGDIDSCLAHTADYAPADWVINLSEILRMIQFYNVGEYRPCLGDGEDGFCPGAQAEGAVEGEGFLEGEGLPEGEGLA